MILSASVREGRASDRVAAYFEKYITGNNLETDLVDLKEFDFPIFHERLKNLKEPPQKLIEFTQRIMKADGIVIVTPEYNGGYPASLKMLSMFYTMNGTASQ